MNWYKNLKLIRDENSNSFRYQACEIRTSHKVAAVVENLVAGICGTDFDLANKYRSDTASILGHEGIGRIVSVENECLSKVFSVGDVVVYNPVSPINQDHILGHSYSGIFQNFTSINREDIPHQIIKKIPENTPLWAGAIIEPLSIAIYAYEIVSVIKEPRDVLIMGSGVFAHILAFYLTRKKCNVTIISRSYSRVKALQEKNSFINYAAYDEIQYKKGFDAIFSCFSRQFAIQGFEEARNLAGENCVIDLVNGFNRNYPVMIEDENEMTKNIDLSDIRRINWSGHNKKIFKLKRSPDASGCYLTGHRGSSSNHFFLAIQEIISHPDYYRSLIARRLPFKDLGDFLNKPSLSIGNIGKVLVQMKDSLFHCDLAGKPFPNEERSTALLL